MGVGAGDFRARKTRSDTTHMDKATGNFSYRQFITAALIALTVLLSASSLRAGNGSPILTITPGLTSTVAGNGTAGYSGDGSPATGAELNFAMGVARDSEGNLYIADFLNGVVRKVATDGTITTVAGNGTFGYSGDGGPATSAQLSYPSSVALDGAGNLYIADYANSCVRKVNTNGIISTFATGFVIRGVVADKSGNVYFSSFYEGVWKVDSEGVTTRIAGTGNPGFSGDGGPALNAQTNGVGGLAVDNQGNLYLAEVLNSDVRKIDTNGIITTVAGNQQFGFSGDGGPATQAQFNGPTDVRVDPAGDLYIVDSSNNRVRKVDATGTITSIAGGNYGYSGDGGLATSAWFAGPTGIELADDGGFFIGDTGNSVIRKVTGGTTTLDFGTATVGQTAGPIHVIISNAGNQDLNVSNVTASASFSQQTTCSGDSLQPGFSCSIDVAFTPLAGGNVTGTVTITDDASGSPHIINLKGQGVPLATQLKFGRTFTSMSLNSNLGSVPVDVEDAQGNIVAGFNGSVSLQLQGPSGFATFSTQGNATAGVATFDLSSVTLNQSGSYTITAASTGLTSVQAQFSVTASPDFSISTTGALSVTSGSSGTLAVTVTPTNGFTGTIQLSCSGLPDHSTCSFSPSSLQASGNNAQLSSTMTISTGVASVASVQQPPAPIVLGTGSGIFGIGIVGLVLGPVGLRSRKDTRKLIKVIGLLLFAIVLLGALVGCQGIANGNKQPTLLTPRGTYTVTVTAASGNLSHSASMTLTVQ